MIASLKSWSGHTIVNVVVVSVQFCGRNGYDCCLGVFWSLKAVVVDFIANGFELLIV
jgi:hypothetical protein